MPPTAARRPLRTRPLAARPPARPLARPHPRGGRPLSLPVATGAWRVSDVRRAGGVFGSRALSWAEAADDLACGALGPFLDEQLQSSPHAEALFWETPALSRATAGLEPHY